MYILAEIIFIGVPIIRILIGHGSLDDYFTLFCMAGILVCTLIKKIERNRSYNNICNPFTDRCGIG